MRRMACFAGAAALLLPQGAGSYPGGTPDFQTDVAPFCATCHSSLDADAMAGSGERAEKEVADRKHYAVVLAGQDAYQKLSEADRKRLVEHLRAVDAAASVELEFPPQVEKGKTFQVTARLVGGAGPVVGVALVDRANRRFAKPASTAGWTVVGAPSIIGPDGRPQTAWLERRPERDGRNVSFVNVTGVQSNAAAGKWSKAKVIWTLKAPDKAGDYPLVAAFFYGTETASPLGTVEHPLYGKQPRGGFLGKSGRVLFSDAEVISVK